MTDTRERGFSMIELLIAMTVTLIVTGAMYGLLAGGQNAFKREPALTDRQQNIRLAMSLIQSDASAAGMGLTPFTQVFTPGLNDISGGLASVITPGQHVDSLEFLGSQGDCQPVSALSTAPVTGTAINTVSVVPACYAATQPVLISYPGGFTKPGYATMTTVGTPPPAGRATFAATQPAWSQVPDAACLVCARPPVAGSCGGCTVTNPTGFSTLGMYRYQIAPDTDGTPSLWRSSSGGCGVAAGVFACVAPPSAQGGWQQVARGIEDLQVRYMDGGGAWADTPTVSDCGANCNASPTATVPTTAEYNTITRQIEVVLSGRAVAPGPRLQGAMESDQGAAVRGQLRTVIVPRGVLINLNSAVNVQWR